MAEGKRNRRTSDQIRADKIAPLEEKISKKHGDYKPGIGVAV